MLLIKHEKNTVLTISTIGSVIGGMLMALVIITVIVVTVFAADAIYKEDSIVEGEQFYPIGSVSTIYVGGKFN